jgi:hypothetical protein
MLNGLPVNQDKLINQPDADKIHFNKHPFTIIEGGIDSNRPSYANKQHINEI